MSTFNLIRSIVIGSVLLAAPLWAADHTVIADFSSGVDAKGVPKGWMLKEKTGKADFAVVKEGTIHALRLRSAKTSFSIQKEVKIDLKQFPVLTWKWKVTELPRGGNFKKSKTDDQAAQIFLVFSKTEAIVYLWDSTSPKGTMDNAVAPFFMTLKAIVVESGSAETGKWITETRNVYEDYRKLFGKEPPQVNGVRLQTNSQHTGTSAESFFADVVFKKK